MLHHPAHVSEPHRARLCAIFISQKQLSNKLFRHANATKRRWLASRGNVQTKASLLKMYMQWQMSLLCKASSSSETVLCASVCALTFPRSGTDCSLKQPQEKYENIFEKQKKGYDSLTGSSQNLLKGHNADLLKMLSTRQFCSTTLCAQSERRLRPPVRI